MHGAFIVGLNEMIINKFDNEVWLEILESVGFEHNYKPISNQEVNDDEALLLVKASIKKLNLGERAFGEMFGNYWIKYFAKEKYFAFFAAYKNMRDFLNEINLIHTRITANLKNPGPPRFEIVWENPYTAVIYYHSKRQLSHIAVGLLKALGDYYREEISVFKVDANQFRVLFKT